MARARRSMPPSVAYVLIILGLHFFILGQGFLSNLFRGDLLLTVVLLVKAIVSGALIAALYARQRLAWQWGRLVGALGGGLLFLATCVAMVFLANEGKPMGILFAGVPMIISFLEMGMCYAMSRRAALEYFDLICPACGEDRTRAHDFFFKTVRCTACRTVWRDSARYVPSQSPFGPDHWSAQAHASDSGDAPLDVLPVETAAPTPVAQRPEVPFDLSKLSLTRPRRPVQPDGEIKQLGCSLVSLCCLCIFFWRFTLWIFSPELIGKSIPPAGYFILVPIWIIGIIGAVLYFVGWIRAKSAGPDPGDAPLDVLPADPPARPGLPVLDVQPAIDEALTTAPPRAPAPLPMPSAPQVTPAAMRPESVAAPARSKSSRPLLLALAGVGALTLLLVGGGMLYFATPITGSNAKPPTSAAADVSPDWVVVFRSRDPKLWNREVNRGPDDFAHRASGVPEDIEYLRLTNAASGDFVILPITKDQLPKREEDKRYGWDGENFYEYKGHHLGVFNSDWHSGRDGQIYVCGGPHLLGWGFGHIIANDTGQGYSWAGKTIAPTVFEIAVRKGALTKFEATKLLAGR